MEDLKIDIYAFLGVLECALLLLVITLFFFVRNKKLAGRLRLVQAKLKKAQQLPEPVTFSQYLSDELRHTQDLIERASVSPDDADRKVAELMEIRKQFLELEVEARVLESNPIAFQDKLAAGLSELMKRWRPEAEIMMEPEVEAVETTPQQEEVLEEREQPEQRKRVDTHDAEFDRLKELINNQQDAMQALRKSEEEIFPQDEKHQLQSKVLELEAMVEFKDVTIEELEKQYSELEARFLAVSGDKQIN